MQSKPRGREFRSAAKLSKGKVASEPMASIDVSQSFQNLLDTAVHSIPKILVFLAVLVVGWIIAKVLARIVDMVLRKVKFDHFVERGVVGAAPPAHAGSPPEHAGVPSTTQESGQ